MGQHPSDERLTAELRWGSEPLGKHATEISSPTELYTNLFKSVQFLWVFIKKQASWALTVS